jgi:hypothetical protein
MATNQSRSLNTSMVEGATDGKYRKVRPNTTVVDPSTGDDIMRANRSGLNPYMNYDFIEQEATVKVNPLSNTASSAARRSSMSVADTENNQMGANY